MRYENYLDLIGNTPLVRLRYSPARVPIYAKLEKFNPGGSVKDRIAKGMIEAAERVGSLTEDKTIIEPTSGNTGIGLALVCLMKGYRLTLVMPDTMTMERRQILMSLGARIVLTEGSKGMDGAEDFANSLVRKEPKKYFMPNQFANLTNPAIHYDTTGEEIWKDTEGRVSHFVAGLGTSGTIVGVSKCLKSHNPKIRVIGVQPDPKTPIQGLKNYQIQHVPSIWDPLAADEMRFVMQGDAEDYSRALTLREGIFSGISSGAAYKVATEIASEIDEGLIVFMAPDGGEKYLSTTLCDPQKCLDCVKKYGLQCSYDDGRPVINSKEFMKFNQGTSSKSLNIEDKSL